MYNSTQRTNAQHGLQTSLGYLLVLAAGAGWACLGIFFRLLGRHEVPTALIAFNRTLLATVFLGLLALRNPHSLRVRPRDLPLFAGFGLGIAIFFWIYIRAVEVGSVALAAVLLYTAPIWIVLFAWLRWHEPLTKRIVLALGLAVAGSAFVALGAGKLEGGWLAIGLGLLSGIAYALYSLFSNEGLRRGYEPATVVFYAMGFGAIFLLPWQSWGAWNAVFTTPATWPALIGVALVSTVLAPVCYAAGQRRIGVGPAGILATVEPVLAALMAWIGLNEPLAFLQWIGCACVVSAVVILAQRRDSPSTEEHSRD